MGGAGGHPPRLFASGLSLEKAWIPRPGPGGEPRCRSGPAQVQKEPPADYHRQPQGAGPISPTDAGDLVNPPHLVELVHNGGHLALGADLHHQVHLGVPVRQDVDIHPQDVDLGGGHHRGDVHGQAGAVLGDEVQGGLVGVQAVGVPADLDPPVLLLGMLHPRHGVGTVRPVDGHPVPPGDEAHNGVPRHGGAALGKLHHALRHPGDDDPGDRVLLVPRLGHAGVQGGRGLPLCRGLFGGGPLGGQLLRLLPVLVDQLVPGAVGALLGGGPAVADGGVHLLQGVEADLLQDVGEHLLGGEHPDGET